MSAAAGTRVIAGDRIRRLTACAAVVLVVASNSAAHAQGSLIEGVEPPITNSELQSLSCLGIGSGRRFWWFCRRSRP